MAGPQSESHAQKQHPRPPGALRVESPAVTSRTWGLYGLAIAFAVAPLWVGQHLPIVDLPQHLHLISVLHRLDDPSTLYPRLFQLRGELTPYLGYYYAVWLLAKVFGLFTANQVFLTAVAVLTPVSLAALLRSLGRSPWLAMLACPLFYLSLIHI